MAGDEFGEFVALLVWLVRLALDTTINVLCLAAAIAGCLPPWRFIPVAFGLISDVNLLGFKHRRQNDLRRWALSLCGQGLVDLVVVPLAVISLLWPPRWPRLWDATWHSRFSQSVDFTGRDGCMYRFYWNASRRFQWAECFGYVFKDVVTLPFTIIAVVLPWETATMVLDISAALAEKRPAPRGMAYDRCLNRVLDKGWCNGWVALLSSVPVAFSLLSFVSPLRWPPWVKVTFSPRDKHDLWTAWGFWWAAPFLSGFDLLAALGAAVTLLNPIRHRDFLADFSDSRARHHRRMADRETRLALLTRRSSVDDAVEKYDAPSRRVCVYFLGITLLDIVVAPMLLVVIVSVYRSGPLWRALRVPESCRLLIPLLSSYSPGGDAPVAESSPHGSGLELGATVEIAPAAAPAAQPQQNHFSSVHRAALEGFLLLCCDLLAFPCTLLVFGTYYRHAHAVRTAKEPWRPLDFHRAIVFNALLVLHDTLALPLMAVLLFTGYRTRRAWRLLRRLHLDNTRVGVWDEVGQFLLDLLTLPVLLIVLGTAWRADLVIHDIRKETENWPRRRAILLHALKLGRDVLGFFLGLIVAVFLYRLPGLLLDLFALRAQPLRSEPRIRLNKVTMFLPLASEADRRPRLKIAGVQPESRSREDIGDLFVNVTSKSFWQDVAVTFGGALASLGQGLLPVKLQDGKHLKYDDFMPAVTEIDLRLGGKEVLSKLKPLDPTTVMCLQVEHRRKGADPEVMFRIPLPISALQQAAATPGEEVALAEEALGDNPPDAIAGKPYIEGVGLREGMWLCNFRQLGFLLQDILHLVLLVLTVLVPWRLAQCIHYLWAPQSVWLGYIAHRAVHMLTIKEKELRHLRLNLEPALNAAAKRHAKVMLSSTVGARPSTKELLQQAEQKMTECALPPATVLRFLMAELRDAGPSGQALKDLLKAQSSLLDAANVYWPCLIFAANSQLPLQGFDDFEHAQVVQRILAAEQHSEALVATAAAARAEALAAAAAAAAERGRGCCGDILKKPRHRLGHVVRIFFGKATMDCTIALLLVLLVLTVYRLPKLVAQLHPMLRDGRAPFSDCLRVVVGFQVGRLACDIKSLALALVATLLALVTLVRALDFFGDVWLRCSSLADVKEAGFARAKEAVGELWELVSLLFLWKTYRCLVRAAIFGIFLPASGLRGLPAKLRLAVWVALCAVVICWSSMWALVVAGGVVLIFFAGSMVHGLGHDNALAPMSVRFNGPNVLLVLSVALEAAVLCDVAAVAPFFRHQSVHWVIVVLTVAWLLVVSLPFGMPQDDKESCLGSLKFHVAVHVLRRLLVVPALIGLLADIDERAGTYRLSAGVLLFLVTTLALGFEQLFAQGVPPELGLDLSCPALYCGGVVITQVWWIAAELLGAPHALRWLAALAWPLWTLCYTCFRHIGGPPSFSVLALSTSLAPLTRFSYGTLGPPALGLGAGLVAAAVAIGLRQGCTARTLRSRLASESDLLGVLQALRRKSTLLSQTSGAAPTAGLAAADVQQEGAAGWAPYPAAIATMLETFEAEVRFEHLSAEFLKERDEWLTSLRTRQHSFESVVQAANKLCAGLRTPPRQVLLIAALKSSSPAARRVTHSLWAMIMEGVWNFKDLDVLLKLPLEHFVEGDAQAQLHHAQASITWCAASVGKLRGLRQSVTGEPLAESNAVIDLPVRRCGQGIVAQPQQCGIVRSVAPGGCRIELAAPFEDNSQRYESVTWGIVWRWKVADVNVVKMREQYIQDWWKTVRCSPKGRPNSLYGFVDGLPLVDCPVSE